MSKQQESRSGQPGKPERKPDRFVDEKRSLDLQDRRLAAVLTGDGLRSAGELARDLGVTAPTVRSRLKALLADGAMRIAALVNPSRVKGLTVALVGITVTSHRDLGDKLNRIAALPAVHWAAVVTGRYDILVEVVLSEDIGDLYRFMDQDLSGIGGIASSETFVVMKARRKWLLLPSGVRERLAGGVPTTSAERGEAQ